MVTHIEIPPIVRIEDGLAIPAGVEDLDVFRRWMRSDCFPERGRIDFLAGTVEVHMSAEELQGHGKLKSRLHAYLEVKIGELDAGEVYVDDTRLTSPDSGLSCEPDVLFVSWEALKEGRARYLSWSTGEPERYMEIEGAVDLVVEVVSRSSRAKDTVRLPPLYAKAGVRELWIADPLEEELSFQIFHLEAGEYQPAPTDEEGFQRSVVLSCQLRLRRKPGPLPHTWRYFINEG
jgi:Uma2 family endonuclease